jgi:hypothetical protein
MKDFKFSCEDREQLWNHIRERFGPKKATVFVDWLQVRCSTFVFLNTKIDRTTHHQKLKKIIDHLKLSQRYLDQIGLSFDPFPQRTFADTEGQRAGKIMDTTYFINEYRDQAFDSLQKIIEILENALKEQPLQARLKGVTSTFVQCIADDYEKILKVRATSSPKDHFFQLIQLLFSALKLPSEYPIRAIKEALNARK